jgi:hypothetical protein
MNMETTQTLAFDRPALKEAAKTQIKGNTQQ